MSLLIQDFVKEPTINDNEEKIVSKDGKGANGALVDWSVSQQYHTEPIYSVDKVEVQGYENYKIADQYTGHAIKDEPGVENHLGQQSGTTYTIEDSGKMYKSGKTYYLGYKTVLVPVI